MRQWCLEIEKEGYKFERNEKDQRIFFERDINIHCSCYETRTPPMIAQNGALISKKLTPDIEMIKAKKAPSWKCFCENALCKELRSTIIASPATVAINTFGMAVTNGTNKPALLGQIFLNYD